VVTRRPAQSPVLSGGDTCILTPLHAKNHMYPPRSQGNLCSLWKIFCTWRGHSGNINSLKSVGSQSWKSIYPCSQTTLTHLWSKSPAFAMFHLGSTELTIYNHMSLPEIIKIYLHLSATFHSHRKLIPWQIMCSTYLLSKPMWDKHICYNISLIFLLPLVVSLEQRWQKRAD